MLVARKIEAGLSIWDYSNILLGGFDNMVQGLMVQNPDFESVDVDLNDFVGKEIAYDDAYYKSKTVQLQLASQAPSGNTKYITGLDGQNIYDIALMAFGNLNNLVAFLSENDWDNINNHNTTLINFKFDSGASDLSVTRVIAKKGYNFATGILREINEDLCHLLMDDGYRLYTDDLFVLSIDYCENIILTDASEVLATDDGYKILLDE